MNDQEITKRRAELEKQRAGIVAKWKQHDRQYLNVADNPAGWGDIQSGQFRDRDREFWERLKAVDKQLEELPRTTGEQLRRVLCLLALVAIVGGAVWLVWRFIV